MLSKIKKCGVYSLALVLLASTLLGSTGSRASAAEASAALTSDFRSLQASQIVSEMGAGWNLGNSLEASVNGIPSETAWNNPTITPQLIQKVKAAGFKTIRIGLLPELYRERSRLYDQLGMVGPCEGSRGLRLQ